MGPDILLILFLVLLNGFFVTAEFAIVKVRLPQVQTRTEISLALRITQKIVQNIEGYLAATRLGITMSSLALGWVSAGVLAKLMLQLLEGTSLSLSSATAHSLAIPVAFLLITVLHLIFGELAPKSIAIRYPMNTALAIAIPLRFFYVICKPFLFILNALANFVLRMIGVEPVPHSEIHSEEELKLIIAESAEGGAIMASERELIQNVFDFDDRTVRQVLKPRTQISALEINTPINEAIDYAISEGYSRFPVYDNSLDNIQGFILVKDLLAQYRKPDVGKTLKELMRPISFVPTGKKISEVLRLFQKRKTQIGIVVNEFGGTVGLITLEDIIEELVGEIQDETDTELPIVEQISEDTFNIFAQNPVDEINYFLPRPFPESQNYVTLSGLILEHCETIPEEKQVLVIEPYRIKVLQMLQNSPELVEVVLLPVEGQQEEESGENG